jgi:hypothetical protein
MIKIAISGKRHSGKDTLAHMFGDLVYKKLGDKRYNCAYYVAFADSMKEIAKLMFPDLDASCLWGPSEARSAIVKDAFKNGVPLTYRQLLMDLGDYGRAYNPDIWINNLNVSLNKIEKSLPSIIVCTDVRFHNEILYLKKKEFYLVRLIRDENIDVNHASETEQNEFVDGDFNYIVYNNRNLEDLKNKASNIIDSLII